jgi:hypothetical protein
MMGDRLDANQVAAFNPQDRRQTRIEIAPVNGFFSRR